MSVGCRVLVYAALIHLLARGAVCRTPRHRDVLTTQGTVRGYYNPQPPHYAFLGLPYARPPTRFARFKPPEPPVPWSGIFEAIHRVKCPQPDGTGEENCLVVNVFTPELASALPVIVHLHDGGFQAGWGSHNAFDKILKQDFILVTLNYRIGAFGFLCLGTEDVSGNSGLKDQVAALYWVNKNIARFGGNPSDVSVYGTGSGAASIEMLLLSGLAVNLFRKIILESGSALSPTSITYEPMSTAVALARDLGFNEEPKPASITEFFYTQPYKNITNTSKIFLPCIENEDTDFPSLIAKDPRYYLVDENYQHVPMLIMYTNAEEISLISNNIERFNFIPENFEHLLPNNLIFDDDKTKKRIADLVKQYYFEDLELTASVIKSYVDYINVIFLEYPIIKSATHHAHKQNTVFLMKLLYKGKISCKNHDSIVGACYKDPFKYISTNAYLSDYDELTAERLITLLKNFIKLGDPTPLTTQLIPLVWQPIVPQIVDGKLVLRDVPCLMFGKNMVNGLISGQQLELWDKIYDKFYIN